MADGEDGYYEGDYFASTIKKNIDIGVCGINIEDQIHKF
jgi:2-methylisocitrate lyase-like PEP mutase family enzyme